MVVANRHIEVSHSVNIRDLGGYPTLDGRMTKWHKLIRAGDLSELSEDDQQTLLDYGITVDVDLRSKAESKEFPDRIPDGMKFVALPLFDNDETESRTTNQRLQKAYSKDLHSGYLRMLYAYRRLVVNEQPQRAYQQFFSCLINSGVNETILYHCSAGKDRTGMLTVLLLSALGVSPEIIRTDYLLTNKFSVPRINHRIELAKKAHMNRSFIASLKDLSSVSIDYLDQAMAIINYEFGGIQAYLRDVVGLSDIDCERLRKIYLE